MKQLTVRMVKSLVIAVLAIVGLAGPSIAIASPAVHAVILDQADCGDTSGFQLVALSTLPPEATDTVGLIQQGGPYPFPQDDGVFGNREGILPACDSGYYREYTVITPGSSTRGARRIITGSAGEYFYTNDHYKSFVLVDINS